MSKDLNSLKRRQPTANNDFVGVWHICNMSSWDEDYFNMEVKAFIEILSNNRGEFHFGLVTGSIDGCIEHMASQKRFSFSWEGIDEMDPASGKGWFKSTGSKIEGEISFHNGDSSTFSATRYEG